MKDLLKLTISNFMMAVEVIIAATTMGTSVGLFFGIPIAMIAGGIMLMYKLVIGV